MPKESLHRKNGENVWKYENVKIIMLKATGEVTHNIVTTRKLVRYRGKWHMMAHNGRITGKIQVE